MSQDTPVEQTTQKTAPDADTSQNTVKVDKYAQELKRLEELAAKDPKKAASMIAEKNRAIYELKREKTNKPTPVEADEEEDVVEVEGKKFKKEQIEDLKRALKATGTPDTSEISEIKELLASLVGDKLDTAISSVAKSETEKTLIKYHLEHSIKSSGNITEDIKRAKILANVPVLESETEEDDADARVLARLSGASISGSGTRPASIPEGQKKALDILRSINPKVDWNKHI